MKGREKIIRIFLTKEDFGRHPAFPGPRVGPEKEIMKNVLVLAVSYP